MTVSVLKAVGVGQTSSKTRLSWLHMGFPQSLTVHDTFGLKKKEKKHTDIHM